jgi:hypothetical protein
VLTNLLYLCAGEGVQPVYLSLRLLSRPLELNSQQWRAPRHRALDEPPVVAVRDCPRVVDNSINFHSVHYTRCVAIVR